MFPACRYHRVEHDVESATQVIEVLPTSKASTVALIERTRSVSLVLKFWASFDAYGAGYPDETVTH